VCPNWDLIGALIESRLHSAQLCNYSAPHWPGYFTRGELMAKCIYLGCKTSPIQIYGQMATDVASPPGSRINRISLFCWLSKGLNTQ
jgi:hypothetical protein